MAKNSTPLTNTNVTDSKETTSVARKNGDCSAIQKTVILVPAGASEVVNQ